MGVKCDGDKQEYKGGCERSKLQGCGGGGIPWFGIVGMQQTDGREGQTAAGEVRMIVRTLYPEILKVDREFERCREEGLDRWMV